MVSNSTSAQYVARLTWQRIRSVFMCHEGTEVQGGPTTFLTISSRMKSQQPSMKDLRRVHCLQTTKRTLLLVFVFPSFESMQDAIKEWRDANFSPLTKGPRNIAEVQKNLHSFHCPNALVKAKSISAGWLLLLSQNKQIGKCVQFGEFRIAVKSKTKTNPICFIRSEETYG